jgi:hypothetical protein
VVEAAHLHRRTKLQDAEDFAGDTLVVEIERGAAVLREHVRMRSQIVAQLIAETNHVPGQEADARQDQRGGSRGERQEQQLAADRQIAKGNHVSLAGRRCAPGAADAN